MRGKVVAVLETRTGRHLGELITRRGGVALLAPALTEVPVIDGSAVRNLLDEWRRDPFKLVIFQTGVGTRALFETADSIDATPELRGLLGAALTVARGPKPTAELNARKIRIDVRAGSPFTTATVLAALSDPRVQLRDAHVLVQRYGEDNLVLRETLEARGARVRDIAVYRWDLPVDLAPLENLVGELLAGRVDAVVFTSAVQVQHLYRIADAGDRTNRLSAALRSTVIASIGPVCSRALAERGIVATLEASPPKLGPLMELLGHAWDTEISAAGP